MEKEKSIYETLSKVKLDLKKKGKFNYASWSSAWGEVKSHYPMANYRVIPYVKMTKKDGNIIKTSSLVHPISIDGGGFVLVSVTIGDITHEEYFPILNNFNKPIKYDFINAFDVNTSIKRGLVKCLALFGLGLWVYNGDDLPDFEE